MLTAMQAADWMLARAQESGVRDMTNMKLNKLIYFAQAHHLAATGSPLYLDPLEAWDHGPVVREVYFQYKPFSSAPISSPKERPEVGEVADELLEAVWAHYGSRTAS